MIEYRDSLKELLHSAVIEEIDPAADFNGQIIRRARVQRRARSLEALTPLFIGAAAAAIGLIALLQVVSQPVGPVKFSPATHEAKLEAPQHPLMPNLTE